MRSRDLPSSRTQTFVLPSDVLAIPRDGYVVYDAPGCREANFSHRLVLDDPPDPGQVGQWLDTWRSHHAGKGIERAYLCWEHRRPDTFDGVERLRCLMKDEEVAPQIVPQIRAIEDRDEALALMSTVEEDTSDAYLRYGRWYLDHLFALCADDWGRFLGWYESGELVGMSAVLWNAREARMQAISVREDHRRKGICSTLVNECVLAYQTESFGIVYVVATDGSGAEACYRKLGFRRVTCDFALGLDP